MQSDTDNLNRNFKFAAVTVNNGVQYVSFLVKNYPREKLSPVRFWPCCRFALSECSLVTNVVDALKF